MRRLSSAQSGRNYQREKYTSDIHLVPRQMCNIQATLARPVPTAKTIASPWDQLWAVRICIAGLVRTGDHDVKARWLAAGLLLLPASILPSPAEAQQFSAALTGTPEGDAAPKLPDSQ